MENNKVIKPSVDMPEQFSVTGTIMWMFGLFLVPGFIIHALLQIPLGLMGYDSAAVSAFLDRPETLIIINVLMCLVAYPMIKAATYHSLEKGLPLDFLAIKPITAKTLGLSFLIAFAISLVEGQAFDFINIPELETTTTLRESVENWGHVVLVVVSIGILAPVLEEIIFRGVIYRRLEKSRLGARGAIIITSVVFTLIHFHYAWQVLLVLLPGSFVLGLVRYKTGNLNYCIAIHCLGNILALIAIGI